MNTPPPLQPGNRERLLQAARELFLELGYDASVDAIISRAGVARQTFYNHFQNKESLFADAVRCCVTDIIAPLGGDTANLKESLQDFARIYRERALSAEGVAIYRILSSQATRFPELIRELFGLGDGKMISTLAHVLAKAMREGQLCQADPVFAAEMLLSMLAGQERARHLFGVPRAPADETAQIGQIVDGFLRMFAPQQSA